MRSVIQPSKRTECRSRTDRVRMRENVRSFERLVNASVTLDCVNQIRKLIGARRARRVIGAGQVPQMSISRGPPAAVEAELREILKKGHRETILETIQYSIPFFPRRLNRHLNKIHLPALEAALDRGTLSSLQYPTQ